MSDKDRAVNAALRWQIRAENAEAALLQVRADAAAAQALILERAAEKMDAAGHECLGCGHLCGDPDKDLALLQKAGARACCPERKMVPLGDTIRALAPDAGTAELAKLRELAGAVNQHWLDKLDAEASLAAQTALVATLTGAREIVDYVLQEPIHNRLVPRVVDIAYSAFMNAKRPSPEDGGPTDWFTDTYPMVMAKIAEIRAALEAAEIATMTPEQRANYAASMAMRAVAKGIAEVQTK